MSDIDARLLGPWTDVRDVTIGDWTTVVAHRAGARMPLVLCELLLSWSVDDWARGALGSTSTASRLHDVGVPTIWVAGEVDSASPPPVLPGLVDVLPDARLEVVRGGPHLFPIESPEATAELLMRHRRAVTETNARPA